MIDVKELRAAFDDFNHNIDSDAEERLVALLLDNGEALLDELEDRRASDVEYAERMGKTESQNQRLLDELEDLREAGTVRQRLRLCDQINSMKEERERLLAVLKVVRTFCGPEVVHGEDCSSCWEDDPEPCDCGAVEFYNAVQACADIDTESL